MTEIRGYTLAQVRAFTKAIDRAEARARKAAISDRLATRLKKSEFTKYMKGLDGPG